jgi:tetratricopeptide (TPR) repeat protein
VSEEASGPVTEQALRGRLGTGYVTVDDYLELAGLLTRGSRFQDAVEIYQDGLRQLKFTNAERARLAYQLGALLEGAAVGTRAEAACYAKMALSYLTNAPDSFDVSLIRGLTYSVLAHGVWFVDRGAGEDAARLGIRWLQQVVQQYGTAANGTPAYYELARLYSALRQPLYAIECCENYLQGDLDDASRVAGLTVLAEAQESAGRLEDAESTTKEALRHTENSNAASPALYYTLGLTKLARKQLPEARAAFEAALRSLQTLPPGPDPEMARALYWALVQLHFELGNLSETISTLRQLLAHYAEDVAGRRRVYLWLGDCYTKSGNGAEARRCYEEVLSSSRASDEEREAAREGLSTLII